MKQDSGGTPVLPAISADLARSWLLVPATRPELFHAAVESQSDAVILDIEDAVIPTAKPASRDAVVAWLSSGGSAWVRINDITTGYWADDLAALAGLTGLQGVMLAKTESAEQVQETAARLHSGARVLALVETAIGIEAANDIARARATFRLAFGSGDFRRDTGASDAPDALAYARARLVVSSRVGRLPGPIDGPTLPTGGTNLTGDGNLADDSALTVSMGMTGKLCMQPEQAPVVNRVLAPTPEQVVWAREVIEVIGESGERVRNGSDLPKLATARKIAQRAKVFGVTG